MDQNRQKLMIGALAVVALGAGVYWGVFRDSSAAVVVDQEARPIEKRQRQVKAEPEKKTQRRAEARVQPEAIERAERAAPDERAPTAKSRRSAGERLKKKEVLKPAA